jgi:HSP20 family protein
MTEVKEAPKPKTTNGQGQTKELTPRATMTPKQHEATPFAFMRRFTEEMNRLFEDFGLETGWLMPRLFPWGERLLGRKTEFAPVEWTPRIEVLEREGQFVVRADLPGMNTQDVKVEIAHDHITLEGERKEEKKEEREGYYYGERRYGCFYRAIPLPQGVDTTKATAEFHKGVLEVVMPKVAPPEPKVRRLEVREAN